MRIIHIKGPAGSGKTLLANSLRNTAIGSGNGCLLIDEDQEGEPRYLLEKIILAEPLEEPRDAGKIPWKGDPLIVVVNNKVAVLDELEALAPGLKKMAGKMSVLELTEEKLK